VGPDAFAGERAAERRPKGRRRGRARVVAVAAPTTPPALASPPPATTKTTPATMACLPPTPARSPAPSRKQLNNNKKQPTDKLAATKAHDKEVAEALQSRRAEEKGKREAEKQLEKEADKFDRDALHPDSKAAKADARHAAAKEHKHERHAGMAECEHNQKNCKICMPRHK
jgi:hypothetical protein